MVRLGRLMQLCINLEPVLGKYTSQENQENRWQDARQAAASEQLGQLEAVDTGCAGFQYLMSCSRPCLGTSTPVVFQRHWALLLHFDVHTWCPGNPRCTFIFCVLWNKQALGKEHPNTISLLVNLDFFWCPIVTKLWILNPILHMINYTVPFLTRLSDLQKVISKRGIQSESFHVQLLFRLRICRIILRNMTEIDRL